MRLIFFGSGSFGLPTLRAVMRDHEVLQVVSQPDRPAGRRRHMTPTPISAYALESALPLARFECVNADDAMRAMQALEADAWVVIAYGQKLSQPLLREQFAINLHGSLLPRWRGAAPIHHAVLAGDTQTGVSVITLADRMDAGDVLATAVVPILTSDTTGRLHATLAERGSAVVEKVLQSHRANSLRPQPQDEAMATAAPKVTRTQAHIDPAMAPSVLRTTINGCAPWPAVTAGIGGHGLRLLQADTCSDEQPLGTVSIAGVVGCAGGCVRLLEVQPDGGRPMPFEAWARGRRLEWPAAFTGTVADTQAS
jgi:methionyl-tRNA formyltransferase